MSSVVDLVVLGADVNIVCTVLLTNIKKKFKKISVKIIKMLSITISIVSMNVEFYLMYISCEKGLVVDFFFSIIKRSVHLNFMFDGSQK